MVALVLLAAALGGALGDGAIDGGSTDAEVDRGAYLYAEGAYASAARALEAALERELPPAEHRRALTFLMASRVALGERPRARAAATALLRDDPRYRIDAAVFPRPAVELLEEVRAALPKAGLGGLSAGLRADLDGLGLGIAPGLAVEYSGDDFGVAGTVLLASPVALRIEGRYYPPLRATWVRPYVAAGATAILPAVGLRAAVGADFRIGRLQLLADVAYERFVADARDAYASDALLLGAAVGWVFF